MDRKQTEAAKRAAAASAAFSDSDDSGDDFSDEGFDDEGKAQLPDLAETLSLNRPNVLKLEPVGPLDAAKGFIESLWPTDEDDEPAPAPARRKRAKVNPAPAPARRGRSQRGASQRFSSRGHDDDDGSSKQPFFYIRNSSFKI